MEIPPTNQPGSRLGVTQPKLLFPLDQLGGPVARIFQNVFILLFEIIPEHDFPDVVHQSGQEGFIRAGVLNPDCQFSGNGCAAERMPPEQFEIEGRFSSRSVEDLIHRRADGDVLHCIHSQQQQSLVDGGNLLFQTVVSRVDKTKQSLADRWILIDHLGEIPYSLLFLVADIDQLQQYVGQSGQSSRGLDFL